jgi:hypothetical protein
MFILCLYFVLSIFYCLMLLQEDLRRHLESGVHELMASSIIQCLGTMIDTVSF